MNVSALGILRSFNLCSGICRSVFVPAIFDLLDHLAPTLQDHQASVTTVAMGRKSKEEEVASGKHLPVSVLDPGLPIPFIFQQGLLIFSVEAIESQHPLAFCLYY
jgi:hypothetical protein